MEELLLKQAKLIGMDLPQAGHKLPFGAVYAVGDNPASDIAGARSAGELRKMPSFQMCMTMQACASCEGCRSTSCVETCHMAKQCVCSLQQLRSAAADTLSGDLMYGSAGLLSAHADRVCKARLQVNLLSNTCALYSKCCICYKDSAYSEARCCHALQDSTPNCHQHVCMDGLCVCRSPMDIHPGQNWHIQAASWRE